MTACHFGPKFGHLVGMAHSVNKFVIFLRNWTPFYSEHLVTLNLKDLLVLEERIGLLTGEMFCSLQLSERTQHRFLFLDKDARSTSIDELKYNFHSTNQYVVANRQFIALPIP